MIELPHEMRETLVDQVNEYLDSLNGVPDGEDVAARVVEIVEAVADELKLEGADEIVLKLESSGQLEASLQEVLEEEFEREEEFEFSGEELVAMIEKVCDVDWSSKDTDDDDDDDDDDKEEDDDEDDPDGFFDEIGGDDEEDM